MPTRSFIVALLLLALTACQGNDASPVDAPTQPDYRPHPSQFHPDRRRAVAPGLVSGGKYALPSVTGSV